MVAAADLDDANQVTVFVAEELHNVGAILDVGVGDLDPGNGVAGLDGGVDLFFDGGELPRGDGFGVEVKSETLMRDAGSLLGRI